VHWTVGISPRGVGPTGRGNEFPLPCLPRSKYLTSPAPPPRPRLRQRRPTQFAGTLTPPAFPREYPYSSAGTPHPARAFVGIPIRFCRHPHPTRAFGAPPPPPPGGGGSAWRYQGSSRARGVAGEQPCPALLQDLPVHWTVGISPLGVGPTGRGNSFPLPCLLRSKYLTSPAPPTPPAPSALLPRPLPGAWAVRGDIKGAAVSGV